MKRFEVVISFLIIFMILDIHWAKAQFSEAGVEQFRVAMNAPDFKLKVTSTFFTLKLEIKGK